MLDAHLIAKPRPLALPGNVFVWECYRVTVLQDRLFRVERSEAGKFRDAATQSVWYRDMPQQDFSVREWPGRCVVRTAACRLILKRERSECLVELDGKLFRLGNAGNLKGTYRTLDGWNGDEFFNWSDGSKKRIPLGTGVCSTTGVAVYDDAPSLTLGETGKCCRSEETARTNTCSSTAAIIVRR